MPWHRHKILKKSEYTNNKKIKNYVDSEQNLIITIGTIN